MFFEEIANDEVKDGRIQPQLPNTIEVKCQDKGPDGHKGEHPRCLDEERMAFVQNYLERADDARSVKTETSDSGMETRSALSELEMEERTGKAVVFFSRAMPFVFAVLTPVKFPFHLTLLTSQRHSVKNNTGSVGVRAVSAFNTHGKRCKQLLAQVETTRCHDLKKKKETNGGTHLDVSVESVP